MDIAFAVFVIICGIAILLIHGSSKSRVAVDQRILAAIMVLVGIALLIFPTDVVLLIAAPVWLAALLNALRTLRRSTPHADGGGTR